MYADSDAKKRSALCVRGYLCLRGGYCVPLEFNSLAKERRQNAVKAILSFSLVFLLCLTSYGQEVTVEDISSPTGGFYRQGYYQPVEVLLSAGRQGASGMLELTAGKITFATHFEVLPESRRKVPLQIASFESPSPISMSILLGNEKFSFPAVAEQFEKTLTCVASDKQLVAVIEDSPDESISHLFKKEEIVTVQINCARVPTESLNLSQFDAVVVGAQEWLSLQVSQSDAIEEFVGNGGAVFIPRRPLFPLPVADKEIERCGCLVANRWGMGKVIYPAAGPEYEKSLRAKDPQLKEDLLRMLGLLRGRLHPNPLLAPGAAELFESLPLFENFRTNWFLILCIYVCAALLGIGCSASGIWKPRYGLSLFLLSVIASSLSLAVTFPDEPVNVRRGSIFLLHSGARQARVAEIVSITSESSEKTVDRLPLAKSGLLKPLFHDWSDYFRSKTVVEQPSPALLRLSVSPPTQSLFQIDSSRRISGGIFLSFDRASRAVKAANRSGIGLNDCLFIRQERAFLLGNLPSGEELEALDSNDPGFALAELIATMKRAQDSKSRSRGAILSYAFRTLCNPETAYLVGWREDFALQPTATGNNQELYLIAEQLAIPIPH